VKKLFTDVDGKELMLFAHYPGPEENESGNALVGKSGKFIWKEFKRAGLVRDHFDIQHAVRCFPVDVVTSSYDANLKPRDPSAKETKCCAVHTQQAMGKSKAKQIVILGAATAKAVLQVRTLPPQKVFWSDLLNARVYLLDHPQFFIRGYATEERLAAFRETIDQIAKDRASDGSEFSDDYAYLKKQDYRLVLNEKQAWKAVNIIRQYAELGRRISLDIENRPDGTLTCVGLSPKAGLSFVCILSHKDQDPTDGEAVAAIVNEIVADPAIEKVLHYGVSDAEKYRESGIELKGYTHDTLLSEYLRFSDRKKYGLDEIADTRFTEFSGYKSIVGPEMVDYVQRSGRPVPVKILNGTAYEKYKWITSNQLFHIDALSLETLRLYNGADADLTKRIEISNKKHVPQNLLQLYIDLSFVLYRMEPNGPLFDYKQHAKLDVIYPARAHQQLQEVRAMIQKPDFNPNSPAQVYKVIYEDLELEYPFSKGKPDTRKGTMKMLGKQHPFPLKLIECRTTGKAKSTYVDGYKTVADFNGGKLRTTWRSTGTRTGRLSSGGDRGKAKTKVNLQNIHGDAWIQNMLVADERWRTVYKIIEKCIQSSQVVSGYVAYLDDFYAKQKSGVIAKDKQPVKPPADYKDECKRVGKRIVKWVRNNMPDLKIFFISDYGQVEVRVAAQMAGDKALMADCAGADIHTVVGVAMTGWDADRIRHDKAIRTITKNVHFGILFGIRRENLYDFVVAMTPPEMAGRITREQVYAAFDRYFKRYSGIRAFIDSQRAFGRANKYVQTLFGMKQHLNYDSQQSNDDFDEDEEDSEFEEFDPSSISNKRGASPDNQAVNGPVQGTAHQLMECALINCYRQPEKYKALGVPMMDVHDALYLRVNFLDLQEVYDKARYLLEHESLATVASDFPDIKWEVPIITEAEAGFRLGCKIDLKEGFDIGDFCVEWYKKCKKQLTEVDVAYAQSLEYLALNPSVVS
jgi:uracil-DNA glycosylase family 4